MTWVRAFARQACSDFDAWECLCRSPDVAQCQQLHALQMAMEKAAKAHMIATGADPMSIQSSHAYIAKHIPRIVASELGRTKSGDSRWVMLAVRRLARRIELLHPQVTDGGAVPANCEYPWQNAAGEVLAPAEYNFGLNLQAEKAALTMIRTVRARAAALAAEEVV